MKKTVFVMMLTLLILSMLMLAFNVRPVRAWGKSYNVAVVDDYYGSAVGYLYPSDYPDQTFSTLSASQVSAETLANYDTVILFMFNPSLLTAAQKSAIDDWVYKGGKLIIWDSDQVPPGSPWDYTWLPYPFTTSVPGQTGARTGHLEVMEENELSSSDPSSPYYIDTSILTSQTDAVGDANVLVTYSPGWHIDMMATNVLGETGPAHVYAAFGSGLIIYSALDWNYAGYNISSGEWLKKLLKQELECSYLPFGVPTVPEEVGLIVDVTPKTQGPYHIGDTIEFEVTVTNPTDVTGINVIAYNAWFTVVPPDEIETPAVCYLLGDIVPGESKSSSFEATAKKAGENVEIIVNAYGEDHLLGTIIAGSGKCLISVYGPETEIEDPKWSFAIITDPHVGYSFPDYDGPLWDDSGEGQDNYYTRYLVNAVEKIKEEKKQFNIKFVVVLGDFADTAEKSEFLKARKILSELNDAGIPYIPVIGDHDQWPYTQEPPKKPNQVFNHNNREPFKKEDYARGDRFFNEVFWSESYNKENLDLIYGTFNIRLGEIAYSTSLPGCSKPAYLQNRNFSYRGINFICLDFNPRTSPAGDWWGRLVQGYNFIRGRGAGPLAARHEETMEYLEEYLKNHAGTMVILSHHPLYYGGGFLTPGPAHIAEIVSKYGYDGRTYNFAGHTHRDRPMPDESRRYGVMYREMKIFGKIFKDIDYREIDEKSLSKGWKTAYEIIETESVSRVQVPGSTNTGKSIRIVEVENGEIVDYSKILAPPEPPKYYIEPLSVEYTHGSHPEPNEEIIFTVHATTYHGFDTSFSWDFGDGSFGSGSSVKHIYSQEGEYNVTLTVTTKNLITGEEKNQWITEPIYVHSKHVISSLSADLHAISLLTEEDVTEVPANMWQPVLITKNVSETIPIAELVVYFEEAIGDICLSSLVADVDLEEGKSVIYMPSWPEEIEEYKVLFIPSTGAGTVYVCSDATSLEEVSLENADVILNVGETKNGITLTTTFYNGREYYMISGVTGTGGGELKDTIPPTTILTTGEPRYIDPMDNIYISSITPFTLTAEDNLGGTGVALTAYRIHNATYDSGWITCTEPFYLIGLGNGAYQIEYNSTDNAGNVEETNIVAVILRNPLVDTWMTDSDFNKIESFRVIFTPYRNTGLYKLTSTNPGQFYFNILVNNTWPEPLNITIAYSIDDNFTFKGARPIHVYADLNRTIDITANCTFSDNTVTVYNVAPNSIVYVTIHMDYALKKTTWTAEEVEAWYSEHGFNATVNSVTSQVVITDPTPAISAYLIFLIVILPMIILSLGLILLLKYAPLIAARRKED